MFAEALSSLRLHTFNTLMVGCRSPRMWPDVCGEGLLSFRGSELVVLKARTVITGSNSHRDGKLHRGRFFVGSSQQRGRSRGGAVIIAFSLSWEASTTWGMILLPNSGGTVMGTEVIVASASGNCQWYWFRRETSWLTGNSRGPRAEERHTLRRGRRESKGQLGEVRDHFLGICNADIIRS